MGEFKTAEQIRLDEVERQVKVLEMQVNGLLAVCLKQNNMIEALAGTKPIQKPPDEK